MMMGDSSERSLRLGRQTLDSSERSFSRRMSHTLTKDTSSRSLRPSNHYSSQMDGSGRGLRQHGRQLSRRGRLNNSSHNNRGFGPTGTGKIRRSQFLRFAFMASIVWILYINLNTMNKHAATTKQQIDSKNKYGDAPWKLENQTISENRATPDNKYVPPSQIRKYTSPASEFHWDDVDLSQNGNCGWHKCFWRSVSNQTIGYLVAEEKQYAQMRDAVEVALTIQDKFGSKHFHLDLYVVNVTKDFKEKLNGLVHQPAREARGMESKGIYRSTQLIIEKVMIAPDPALFFAAAKANLQLTVNQLEDFRPLIPDKEAFRRQIDIEHERLTKVLADNPLLALDFQAVIDPAGNLFHIDLDGHFSMAKRDNNTDLRVTECLRLLAEVNKNLTSSGIITGWG